MTLPARPTPIAIPLSSLLPASDGAGPSKHAYFPTGAAAILGPLPVTSPFHLALAVLELLSVPEYDDTPDGDQAMAARIEKAREAPSGVLIITPTKDVVYKLLEEDDEEWMRDHGGSYAVIEKLKRVDVRYCPTAGHLKLLLNLLSRDRASSFKDPQALSQVPDLIVLWDTASLLMEDIESDAENVPPATDGPHEDVDMEGYEGGNAAASEDEEYHNVLRRFKPATTISSYLDFVSAARSTVEHLGALDPSSAPPQLVVLEPSLTPDSSLPIMPPQPTPATPSQRASKRVMIADGLRWLLGPDSVGFISPDRDHERDTSEARYTLHWNSENGETDVSLEMVQKPCSKSPHSAPVRLDLLGNPEVCSWQWYWA